MKQIQGSFFSGYVTVVVKGKIPELFFQECINQGIPVWNIKKEGANKCRGNIKLSHIKMLKKIRRNHDYKISFKNKKGFPFILHQFLRKRALLTGLVLGLLLIIFLSNIIWKVEITGVPKDLEEKINKQLTNYGIHPGVWIFTIDSPGDIQKKLENDIPELLWVGVEQKGTTYVLEGVEKLIVEEEKKEGPRDLVATKKGVIKKMYVSKGQPQVALNDYVEPGDLLVSGNLRNDKKDENDEKDNDEDPIYVASEGEVIANTWYEVSVNVPLDTSFESLTGNQRKKYYININDFNIPIWGFRTPDYEYSSVENKQNAIRFLKWDLPVNFVESTISEKEKVSKKRKQKEAVETGVEQAKQELKLQLGPEAEIISENILHETNENGKVKLKLYVSVEENIVKEQSINIKEKKKKSEE